MVFNGISCLSVVIIIIRFVLSEQQLLSGIDDIGKFGLQRGAADQKTVNVGPRRQILAILAIHRAPVENLDLVGHLGADVVLDPDAELLVNVLRLLGRRHHAGANCPDGLVGDDF